MQIQLLDHKSNVNSQNGEDGIISAIFTEIGITSKTCCEFGAWDGIFLSNCRKLILDGWRALMIEGDSDRYTTLCNNYINTENVIPVNCFVDERSNSLGALLEMHNIRNLDFLSVDIDGFDYEILETLNVRPRVICIEVNAGHSPDAADRIDQKVAMNNVGQPLSLFVRLASTMGYELVCYNGNAFFVQKEIREQSRLQKLTSTEAYQQYLKYLDRPGKEWMYLVNLGLVNPFYLYKNPMLERKALGISAFLALQLRFGAKHTLYRRLFNKLRGIVK